MKISLLRNSLVALVATVASYGQNGTTVMVKVPFSFYFGTDALPAGQYTVEQQLGMVTIVSADNKKTSILRTNTNAVQSQTVPQSDCLVFRRYGSQYFLSQVWRVGESRGRQLPTTDRERELSKGSPNPDIQTIAATR